MSEILDLGGVNDKMNSRIGVRIMKKKLSYVALSLVIMLLPVQVFAATPSLTFPLLFVNGGENKITANNAGDGYKLYYQAFILNDSQVEEVKALEEESSKLEDESKSLSTKKNECYAIDDTSEFNSCMSEYKTLADAYNKKVEEFNTKFKNFTPAYDDSKWTDITSTSKFTAKLSVNKDSYICLYGKLVTSDGQTLLDKKFYSVSKTTTDSTTDTNKTTTTKTSSSTEESQEQNPNTGDFNAIFIAVLGILAVYVMTIVGKKMKNVK